MSAWPISRRVAIRLLSGLGVISSRLAGAPARSASGETARSLVDLRVVNPTSTQTNVWLSFGHQFVDGDIPAGHRPQLLLQGAPLADQAVDNEVSWPSGALRRCNFTACLPSLPGPRGSATTLAIAAVAGSQDHTQFLAPDAFLKWASTNSWNLEWKVTIDGATWAMDAITCLGSGNLGYWKRSAAATEFVTWGKLRRGEASHEILIARFEVRAFSRRGTIDNVRSVATLENGDMASAFNQDIPIEDIALLQNGAEVWGRHSVAPAADLTLSANGSGTGDDSKGTYEYSRDVTAKTSAPILTWDHGGWIIESGGSLFKINSVKDSTTAIGYVPYRVDSVCMAQAPKANVPLRRNEQVGHTTYGALRWWGHRAVTMKSSANLSGITFTFTGQATDGSKTETIAGPNNGTVFLKKQWTQIASVVPDGNSDGLLSVGSNSFRSTSIPRGSWRLLPFVFPNHTRLTQITWHTNQARYALSYDRAYLVKSGFMFNYAFGAMGNQVDAFRSFVHFVDYPSKGDSRLYPDLHDTNPFNYLQYMNYPMYEGVTGERVDLGALTAWEFHWLFFQSNPDMALDAERGIMCRAFHPGAGGFPIWMRDAKTGVAPNPADWPEFTDGPTFWVNTGNGGAGFCWPLLDLAHASSRCRVAAFITGDFWLFEAQVFDCIARAYLGTGKSGGRGLTRLLGWAQTRAIAWAWRSVIQCLELYPDTMHTPSIALAKSEIQKWFDYNQTTVRKGFVTPGNTDPYDHVPSSGPKSRGNYHWVWGGGGGAGGNTADFAQYYLCQAIAQGYDNGVLSADGVEWFDWVADYAYQMVTDTSGFNPRYSWTYYRPVLKADSTSFNGLADYWRYIQNDLDMVPYPTGNNLLLMVQTGKVTPGAVSGTGILFKTDRPIFYPTHVGARIQGNRGTARISAVLDERTARCDIVVPFANTSAIDENHWWLGYGNPGPNSDATLNLYRQRTVGGLAAPFQCYGALGAGASHPARNAAAKSAQALYRAWLGNDGYPLSNGDLAKTCWVRYMMEAR